jgi:hypothetical protein
MFCRSLTTLQTIASVLKLEHSDIRLWIVDRLFKTMLYAIWELGIKIHKRYKGLLKEKVWVFVGNLGDFRLYN